MSKYDNKGETGIALVEPHFIQAKYKTENMNYNEEEILKRKEIQIQSSKSEWGSFGHSYSQRGIQLRGDKIELFSVHTQKCPQCSHSKVFTVFTLKSVHNFTVFTLKSASAILGIPTNALKGHSTHPEVHFTFDTEKHIYMGSSIQGIPTNALKGHIKVQKCRNISLTGKHIWDLASKEFRSKAF